MKISELKVNGYENPVGISLHGQVLFSWKIEQMRAKRLILTRLLVYSDPGMKHEIGALQGEQLKAEGQVMKLELAPRTRYYVKLQAVSEEREAAESEPAIFETCKMDEAWEGVWIKAAEGEENRGFLRLFSLAGAEDDYDPGQDPDTRTDAPDAGRRILSGRLYVACSQAAQVLLNGSPIAQIGSDMEGSYLTCNISNYLADENLLEILPLAQGAEHKKEDADSRERSSDRAFAVIGEVYIRRADGSEDLIATGPDWLYRGSKGKDWLPVQVTEGEVPSQGSVDRFEF